MPVSDFEPVIGLEVHCQLKTKSKAFCSCPVVFGAPPNTAVCPVCLGYPGVLPTVNREMVTLAMRVALATGCTIEGESVFARKNYFYPDLPKGYQITQFAKPLATRGAVALGGNGSPKSVRLNRVHLEEDAGKSMHDFPWQDVPTGVSLVDLNRAGTPLIEIVTEPDLSSAEEAHEYLVHLRRLVRWVDASDGNMEEGSLRCDANVSVRRKGASGLGTKVEIKNLNSFQHVKKAIEHEVERQGRALEAGETLAQETRLYEPATNTTKTMRSKEESMDYRYFPDPDLGVLVVDEAWTADVAAAMPELPRARASRFAKVYGLSPADADLVCLSRPLADFFEAAVEAYPKNPKALANWLLSELLARMSDADRHAGRMPLAPGALAALVRRIDDGTISGKIAKELLPDLVATGRPVDDLIEEKGLVQISDEAPIRDVVAGILADHPAQVAAYRGGKTASFGWFVGQVMRATGGKANPEVVNRLLREALDSGGMSSS
jgi:aspartyl-tRNA(Asn)/glutamyl-tRNA(Gln) amidotransferase subunit B